MKLMQAQGKFCQVSRIVFDITRGKSHFIPFFNTLTSKPSGAVYVMSVMQNQLPLQARKLKEQSDAAPIAGLRYRQPHSDIRPK